MLTNKTRKKEGGVIFATFFLTKSLPEILVDRLVKELDDQLKSIPVDAYNYQTLEDLERRKYFKKLDDLLHSLSNNEDIFSDFSNQEKVAEQLESLNGAECNVIAFSLMSNHLHVCIATNDNNDTLAIERIKTEIGVLFESSQLWNPNTNIIPVQDRKELSAMMQFIVEEPVIRELVENKFDWSGTFIRDKYFKLIKPVKK